MHLMVYHFSYFNDKYGNVKQFSCQGLQLICMNINTLFFILQEQKRTMMQQRRSISWQQQMGYYSRHNSQQISPIFNQQSYQKEKRCQVYIASQLYYNLSYQFRLTERRMKHIGRMGAYRSVRGSGKGLAIHFKNSSGFLTSRTSYIAIYLMTQFTISYLLNQIVLTLNRRCGMNWS